MRVKSYHGKIYGADLTTAERRAMDMEINRQLVKRDEQYAEDIDAMVLYALMIHAGWKKQKLRKFWDDFVVIHNQLREHYQMCEPGDSAWLAHRKLKEIGVDIHKWYKEEKE